MGTLKVHNSKRYKAYCTPTGNKEIDKLTEEVYNSYSWNGSPELKIKELLINYFIDDGYKVLLNRCFNILEKEDKPKWLIVRNCQNYVFEIDKIKNFDFEGVKKYPELGEDICESIDTDEKDWVSFLYTHGYPEDDIFALLDVIGIKISETPEGELGELGELD